MKKIDVPMLIALEKLEEQESLEELLQAARKVRFNAYAPYSNYLVGAALLTSGGNIYTGCNIENASYGVTMCAERVAMSSMVAAGEYSIKAFAIVTSGPEIGVPCGMCLQMIAEFADDKLPILLALPDMKLQHHVPAKLQELTTLKDLLPRAFRLNI